MATDLGQNLQNYLYSTRWHFETDSIIAISIKKLVVIFFSTYCANLIKIGPVTPEKLQIVPRFDDRRSFAIPGVRQ